MFTQNFIYGDIIFDQACNTSFHQKIEKIQYNRCYEGYIQRKTLPTIRLRVPSTERLVKKTLLFFQHFWKQSPKYVYNRIPKLNRNYQIN